jgi:hypothetical protein
LIRDRIGDLELLWVTRQYGAVSVSRAACARPVRGPNQHDQPLLKRVGYAREGELQHRIAFFDRQQSEQIGVRRDPLPKPQSGVVSQQ